MQVASTDNSSCAKEEKVNNFINQILNFKSVMPFSKPLMGESEIEMYFMVKTMALEFITYNYF